MTTPTQNRAAITAAIQAAAVADLVLLNAFLSTNGASFVTVENNLASLITNISSTARATQIQTILDALKTVQASFNTLMSTTNDAQTSVPIA